MVKPLTDAQLDAQLSAARVRTVARKNPQRAIRAWYDSARRRVFVELANGYSFGFQPDAIAEIARAPNAQLAMVEVDSLGEGLRWDALDVDVSVPGLMLEALGPLAAKAFAATGGRASTKAKAEAARANGAKGGRPRKAAIVDDRELHTPGRAIPTGPYAIMKRAPHAMVKRVHGLKKAVHAAPGAAVAKHARLMKKTGAKKHGSKR